VIYIYRPTASDGARLLEDTLNDLGAPARFTQGKLLRERFRADRDKLVCWGAQYPGQPGLNNVEQIGKFTEATKLKAGGISTVEVSRTRPIVRMIEQLGDPIQYNVVARTGERDRLIAALEAEINHLRGQRDREVRLIPDGSEWLPRRNNHIGGTDLLHPGQADYWSKKERVVNEFRLHIFKGKSIRAGQKKHREEFPNPHPWIRSYEGGWFIDYAGFNSTKPMRDLAVKATENLGLDFGAVDMGQREDGTLIVFEVNRAPGIEGNTVEAYAEKILEWSRGQVDERRAA
jgi:hypothetical protein